MPSTSKKQHNFMAAVANNPSFAKKVGVPQSVGKDFSNADKGKTFKRGGDMASKMNPGMMAIMAKKKSMQEGSKADMTSDKKQMMGMKKGGMPMVMKDGKKIPAFAAKKGGMAVKKMASGGMAYAKGGGIESKGKTKGKIITMKSGGKMC